MGRTAVRYRQIMDEERQEILDYLRTANGGKTFPQIAEDMTRIRGYQLTQFNVRDRCKLLLEQNKIYRRMKPNTRGTYQYFYGPEPVSVPIQHTLNIPEAVKISVSKEEWKSLLEKIESLDSKMKSLLIRSEYNAKAMIAITHVANELNITIPDLSRVAE